MEPAGEAVTAGGHGTTSVCHVLSSGGPVSPPFWGGDLGFVRGDAKEDIGGSRGFILTDNEAEGEVTEVWDMVAGVSRDGT